MKALCVSGMPNPTGPTPPGTLSRRDEAHALAKKALTLRVSSHVCWHVYGLLHRAERNYPEAIKCYKRALKLEPGLNGGDGQILRDLSHLQIQERDIEGFVESRSALLAARPGQRHNWLPLAVGHHLTGVAMMGGGGSGGGPPSSSSRPSSAAAAGGGEREREFFFFFRDKGAESSSSAFSLRAPLTTGRNASFHLTSWSARGQVQAKK